MKKSIFEVLNFGKALTREQAKKIFGGVEDPGNILCYCDAPILPSGQYEIQWIAESCAVADIAGHCGGSDKGACGAC